MLSDYWMFLTATGRSRLRDGEGLALKRQPFPLLRDWHLDEVCLPASHSPLLVEGLAR